MVKRPALDAFAKQDDRPKSEIMREAFDAYIASRDRCLPETMGPFEDLEVDSTNFDDRLRANWRLDVWPHRGRRSDGAMIKSTFSIESDRMAALDAIAKQSARPKAELIRDALDEYIDRHARPFPAWIGMIDDDDGSLTSTNVDEWLGDRWHPE